MQSSSLEDQLSKGGSSVRETRSLRLLAVGDLSFEGRESEHPAAGLLKAMQQLSRPADVVVANLECPLTRRGTRIPGKCTMKGVPEWAGVLKGAGITVVSLANNHAMDYGQDGLMATIDALDKAGIGHVGAGSSLGDALAPLIIETRLGLVGLLGRNAIPVGVRMIEAGDGRAGVAPFEIDEICESIRRYRMTCNHVVVLVHWGVEEYSYPSPVQRDLARKMAAAGAAAVIGHHPHVIQGMEYVDECAVIYSLGNFRFSEFDWVHDAPDGTRTPQSSKLTRANREGLSATLEWRTEPKPSTRFQLVQILESGTFVDEDLLRAERRVAKLSSVLSLPGYSLGWRTYALMKELRRRGLTNESLLHAICRLHRIRPRHFRMAASSIQSSLRIITEKSTDPYT